jgi:hypothetical protein
MSNASMALVILCRQLQVLILFSLIWLAGFFG